MFLFVIVAEGVDLVYDFGRIFQKVVRPYVAPDDETLDQALNRFVAYYEQSEMFDFVHTWYRARSSRCCRESVEILFRGVC